MLWFILFTTFYILKLLNILQSCWSCNCCWDIYIYFVLSRSHWSIQLFLKYAFVLLIQLFLKYAFVLLSRSRWSLQLFLKYAFVLFSWSGSRSRFMYTNIYIHFAIISPWMLFCEKCFVFIIYMFACKYFLFVFLLSNYFLISCMKMLHIYLDIAFQKTWIYNMVAIFTFHCRMHSAILDFTFPRTFALNTLSWL